MVDRQLIYYDNLCFSISEWNFGYELIWYYFQIFELPRWYELSFKKPKNLNKAIIVTVGGNVYAQEYVELWSVLALELVLSHQFLSLSMNNQIYDKEIQMSGANDYLTFRCNRTIIVSLTYCLQVNKQFNHHFIKSASALSNIKQMSSRFNFWFPIHIQLIIVGIFRNSDKIISEILNKIRSLLRIQIT